MPSVNPDKADCNQTKPNQTPERQYPVSLTSSSVILGGKKLTRCLRTFPSGPNECNMLSSSRIGAFNCCRVRSSVSQSHRSNDSNNCVHGGRGFVILLSFPCPSRTPNISPVRPENVSRRAARVLVTGTLPELFERGRSPSTVRSMIRQLVMLI